MPLSNVRCCKFLSLFIYALDLQTNKKSDADFRPKLAAAMISSCRHDCPAATALAVAIVSLNKSIL